jgi:hypothetical protein
MTDATKENNTPADVNASGVGCNGGFGVSERALNQADCDLAARSVTKEELATLRTENRELRIMCAIAHCGLALYHDDGELQDSREYPWIDWKRDSVSEIEAKLHERAIRRMRAEMEKRSSPNVQDQTRGTSGPHTQSGNHPRCL